GPALRAGVARAMEGGEGWSVEDEELIVSRTVQANGRGRCRLQNRLVPQSVLRAVGEQLLDICGQHEQHSLIRGEQHRQILDEFAGLGAEVSAYRDAYETWRTAAKEWRDLRETVGDAARREDYLRFQMDEIDGLALVEGEYEALRAKLTLLRGVARWRALAQEVQQEVYEREGAVVEVLGRLESQAMEGVDASESLGIMAEHLAAARIACEEAAGEAATLLGRLDVEPGALEQAEARVDQIDDLSRKHGCSADELVARAEAMRRELEDVQAVDLRIEEAYQREQETWRQCCGAALGLRKGRQRASTALASRVNRELAAVQMAAARVQVRLISSVEDVELERGAEGRGATARDGLDASGADRIEILFSGNEGETPAPVSKVASGGELSRLLLAFKTVLAGGSAVETSVFDEVDAGVSGAAAEAVGVRLYRASVGRQVICVTHLPQIAALADHHVRIEKVVEGGRTVSRVRRLSRGERVEEL
ncbi:MAG: DNA repair protein RecN, partial [Nannocystaceae bacterium]